MSYLTLDADRLVRDAVDAYLEGRLRANTAGDCVYATRNSQYRIVDGVVTEASDPSSVGAELVGWLVEELGQPDIEPKWRAYGRAVIVERATRQVIVTSRTLTRTTIGGDVPAPAPRRNPTPSVIPPSPPIPILKGPTPTPDSAPSPFRVPTPHGTNKRETARPPPEEPTVAADRELYDALLDQELTPTWTVDHLAPKAPAVPTFSDSEPRSVRLPRIVPPARRPTSAPPPKDVAPTVEVEEVELDGDDLQENSS